MSCHPEEFLRLAEAIAEKDSCSEIECRCAISRAYYAALHSLSDVFPPVAGKGRIEGESSHAEIIRRARDYGQQLQPGRQNAILIAKLMGTLKAERNQADYRLQESISAANMHDVIQRANRVIEECKDVSTKRRVLNVR